ncbi:MAG TPA: TspO/MBR family protein [Mycobacteriales bacterium]|nr:TspO/MBR family protein [Mycobacteriales bacterium]
MPSSPAIRALGLTGSLGGISTTAATGAVLINVSRKWYDGLDKPRWASPTIAFAPAWSVVAAAQAVGAWLAWRADDERDAVDVPAVSSYAVSVWLSLAWLLLFFGLRKTGWALIEAVVLWVALSFTIAEFARRHRLAAALMLPSLFAVSYLGMLNLAIWRRNR